MITADTIRRNAGRGGFGALIRVIAGPPQVLMGTPHGIAADAKTLAIADSARAVVHFLDLEGGGYRAVETAGQTRLQCPIGVAADGEGGIFLTDSVLNKVFHLSRNGRLEAEIGGDFVRPTGIAYDVPHRQLYIVDTGAHAVLAYQEDGGRFVLRNRIGGRGQGEGTLNFPTHICLTADDGLCVADSLNFRVQSFAADGTSRRSFGRPGDGSGDFGTAKGIAVDADGHIYVVDSRFDVVQIFDKSGQFLLSFGGVGKEAGELWLPTGICIDRENRIYVADSGNSRIQVYQYVHQQENP